MILIVTRLLEAWKLPAAPQIVPPASPLCLALRFRRVLGVDCFATRRSLTYNHRIIDIRPCSGWPHFGRICKSTRSRIQERWMAGEEQSNQGLHSEHSPGTRADRGEPDGPTAPP